VLPAGTQLQPAEGDRIVFETTTAVPVTRSRLVRVVIDDGSGPVDQTEANEKAGIAFLAFGERAGEGAELRLGFDRFYPETEQTIRLAFDLFTDDLGQRCGMAIPVPANGDNVRPVQPVELTWEYLAPGDRWRPLQVANDETLGLARSAAVTLTLPDDAASTRTAVWLRARVTRGYYDIEPRLRRVAVNALPCEQVETVRDEPLKPVTGLPDQSVVLARKRIQPRPPDPPVAIEVGGVPWTLVTSFDAAGPASTVFTFDAETGRVSFGNGLNGRIPRKGEDVRAVLYRTTEGRSGNVAKDLSWTFVTQVVPGGSLKNLAPATGGTDTESLSDLELRAKAQLIRPNRAVTLDDIERLALGTPHANVARAYAIPNCPAPERIAVVAVPKVRPGRTGPPVRPSDAFLSAVSAHLQRRRLLCDSIRVVRPAYLAVQVTARLRLKKGAGSAGVIERARQALDRFLLGEDLDDIVSGAPAIGALQSPCPTRWLFGRSVFPSEVYAVLDAVPGVDAVTRLTLSATRGGTAVSADSTGTIQLPRTGLVFPAAHDLTTEADVGRTS
jgi:predicted phage baseplate assembly protein